MKNTKKGFTIVELVIVIAVIAILAAVLIPTFSSVTSSARASAAQQQAKAGLDSILALTEGSLPDGTLFVITSDSNNGSVDYNFVYSGNKLTQVENDKAVIETYSKPGATDTVYAVYVTASAFAKTGANETELAAVTKNKTAVEKLLTNAIKTISGYTDTLGTATINTADTNNNYYTLTLTQAEGKTLPDQTNVTFRVYYTSDIQETMVAFIGND
ncbi:MAG: type II secretion system protein [Clostridia bacterium]|nr:type II secretion system protein [Clostridia bacterium]